MRHYPESVEMFIDESCGSEPGSHWNLHRLVEGVVATRHIGPGNPQEL